MFSRILILLIVALIVGLVFAPVAAAANAEMFDGKILTVSADKHLTIHYQDDQKTFTINDRTVFTLDGEAARWEDMKPGFTVMIQADREGDHFVARAIAAFNDQ
jgi:hypothetical protein